MVPKAAVVLCFFHSESVLQISRFNVRLFDQVSDYCRLIQSVKVAQAFSEDESSHLYT